MAKLHMRLSVEIDVTDEELQEIVDRQNREWKSLTDTEYEELPRYVQDRIENRQFDLCDWDGGGYIPDSWLEADAEGSNRCNTAVGHHGTVCLQAHDFGAGRYRYI